MKKALMVASVASMIKQFNMPNIQLLQELGYEVTVVTNFKKPGNMLFEDSDKLYEQLKNEHVVVVNVNFDRNPISKNNIQAFTQLKSIINEGNFDLIHCQSPVGGFITRFAAKSVRKKGTKLIYTAHGFHFFKGAPKKNWLIFFPVEKYLSKYTDILITINTEDYNLARKMFYNSRIKYIAGIGVNTQKFKSSDCENISRQELGIPESSFLILSVGELNRNKNHRVIIEALSLLNDPTIHYAICGIGAKAEELIELAAQLKVENQVHLLGFREEIEGIYQIADVFAFPSKREGLGLSAIEAMAAGLPLLTSNVHGINDYSINSITGFKYSPNDTNGFAEGIETLKSMTEKEIKQMKQHNKKNAQRFDSIIVQHKMREIYDL